MHQMMMSGLDWTTADLALREQFSLTQSQTKELNRRLRSLDGVDGAVLLSTCNRTEVYLSVSREDICPGALLEGLLAVSGAPWVHRSGPEAARHLMEVAGGLHSHIWGEDQILTQVKTAIHLSREVDASDPLLETLFRSAATAGK